MGKMPFSYFHKHVNALNFTSIDAEMQKMQPFSRMVY